MKTTQALVFWGRWEMFCKRGAIGRKPGITERKMASLERKPDPDVQTALHHDWRTEGPQADAGLPAGPQSEYVVEALLLLKWDIKMLQFCFQKMICSFIGINPLVEGAPKSSPQGLPPCDRTTSQSSLLVKICVSCNIRRYYLTASTFVFCCFAFFVMLLP